MAFDKLTRSARFCLLVHFSAHVAPHKPLADTAILAPLPQRAGDGDPRHVGCVAAVAARFLARLPVSLLGFNLGREVGQLATIAACLPLTLAIALVWLMEWAFDLKLVST